MKFGYRVSVVLMLILCFGWTVLAYGAAYANIAALYEVWTMEGMPDWVCSVSSTDGSMDNLTVVVKSEEAAEELRAMLEDPGTLTVYVNENGYSQAELERVQEEIFSRYMSVEDSPIHGLGIGWTTIDGVTTGFGESGTESRVVVMVDATHAEEYAALFAEKYGDSVYVERSDGIVLTEETAEKDTAEHPWWLLAVAAILIAAAAVLLRRRKKNG